MSNTKITKKFGVDFKSADGALTLQMSEVTDGNEENDIQK